MAKGNYCQMNNTLISWKCQVLISGFILETTCLLAYVNPIMNCGYERLVILQASHVNRQTHNAKPMWQKAVVSVTYPSLVCRH